METLLRIRRKKNSGKFKSDVQPFWFFWYPSHIYLKIQSVKFLSLFNRLKNVGIITINQSVSK